MSSDEYTDVVPQDPPKGLTSKLLMGGGVVLLIQNIMVLVTFLMIIMKAGQDDFNAGDAKIVETFFNSFYVDIVALLLIGVGFLLYAFGIDSAPSPDEKKNAILAGVMATIWAVFSILWRFVLPQKAADSFIGVFFNSDGGSADEFLLYIRLIIILAVINSIIFVLAFYYLKKFFSKYEETKGVKLVKTKKHPAINSLFQGAIANMIFNLIIFLFVMTLKIG